MPEVKKETKRSSPKGGSLAGGEHCQGQPMAAEGLAYEQGSMARRTFVGGTAALVSLAALSGNNGLLAALSAAAVTEYVQYQMPFPTSSISQHSNPGHIATDFGNGVFQGNPIKAIAAGKVHAKASGGGMGYRIELSHADGMYSGYCHMNAASTLAVGANVARGQTIGYVGNSGVSAYHLHLALASVAGWAIQGSPYSNCTDPVAYIQGHLDPPEEPRTGKSMAVLIRKGSTTPNLYALAGSSPGTPANWLEITDQTFANLLAAHMGGSAATIAAADWSTWKAAFLAPVTIASA